MKKIVTIGAIAAIAGGMMFAQPVFEPSVTLDGSATAKWGVALDAGQTGFQNDTSGDFKVKLWGDGSRELEEGDGVWAELKVTGKETTINKGKLEGGDWELNSAKLHLGPVYIGVTSGDTQVGEYKFDGAIRSADNDHAKYLNNVGPDKFSQGIVVGFANDSFDVGVDFRSYYDDDEEKGTNTKYTSAYAFAAEAKIKDTNEFLPGLAFDAGVGYNFSDHYTIKALTKDADGEVVMGTVKSDNYYAFDGEALEKLVFGYVEPEKAAEEDPLKAQKDTLAALEKAYEQYKAGEPIDIDDASALATIAAFTNASKTVDYEAAIKAAKIGIQDAEATAKANKYEAPAAHLTDRAKETKVHTLGYAFNASYKLAIDDTFYVKPAVGLTGTYVSAKNDTTSDSASVNTLAFGALFGWGDTADANAGVYFLDGDGAKKVTPGISVVAAIPLAVTGSHTDATGTYKTKAHSALQALIVPSVYLGELVPNLKFGAYSEMALLRNYVAEAEKTTGNDTEYWDYAVTKDNAPTEARTFGLAAAFGVAYDIKATDDVTITPKFGLRYANSAYVQNKVGKIAPLASDGLFEAGYDKMGIQQVTTDGKHPDGDIDNYLNIKFGVDAAGLINNTTFFVEYSSANLLYDGTANPNDLNWYKEQNKYYSIKAGYLDVGCKISF